MGGQTTGVSVSFIEEDDSQVLHGWINVPDWKVKKIQELLGEPTGIMYTSPEDARAVTQEAERAVWLKQPEDLK